MRKGGAMEEQNIPFRIKRLLLEMLNSETRKAARLDGDENSWSRKRDMPLQDMLTCTLAKKGLSTAMEVRQYFQAIGKEENTVSKQGYLQQRQKLNPEVFKMLNSNYLKRFYEGEEGVLWNGYLVCAVDGSRAEIPNSKENRRTYGQSVNQHGQAVARADVNVIYDVYNRFLINIVIGQNNKSEIEEAKAHINSLKEIVGKKPLLIILDRYYASLEFIDILEKAGLKYLVRVQKGAYKAELERMQGEDEKVKLRYTKERLKTIKHSEPEREKELKEKGTVQVRILRAELDNGESGIWMTNLQEGSAQEIKQLYRKRWAIEQKYHTLKNKMKFESVTGKASIYVRQDFWAQTLVFNMIQDLITVAEQRAQKKAKSKKYLYDVHINENMAIGLFKEQFIRLMMEEEDDKRKEMSFKLIADIERYIVPIRTLKNTPRKPRKSNKYKCNQKPTF
jgi:hypothetical protein